MNWQNIKVSADNTHFLFEGKQIFEKHFIEVLKFHSPGIAPVFDKQELTTLTSKVKQFIQKDTQEHLAITATEQQLC
jgi:sialic acid synthase SpsE